MALSAGSISIDSETGEHSGSGAAFAMLDAWWTNTGSTKYSGASTKTVVEVKQGVADLLQSIAAGLIDHIVANAEVTVTITTSDGGLQQVDSTDTDPPAADKDLSGTVS